LFYDLIKFVSKFDLLFWKHITITTSCARGDTIYLRPLQVDNIFACIRQVTPVSAFWLFKLSATSAVLECGVRVTCDVGYPCANFSLPRPLCCRLIPDVRDRHQTDVRRQTNDVRQTSDI